MINDTEPIIKNILSFIKNNSNDPNYVYISKTLFSGVSSICISLPDYQKEYSVVIEEGVVSNISEEKRDNHTFSVSLTMPQILRLMDHYNNKNYLALIKEAQKLNIPLKYKLRFGKLYLTSPIELSKFKELLEKHNLF